MLNEAEEVEQNDRKHIVFDVPLLFETGFERYCDRVLCVIADDETRYLRIMLRDGLTRAEAAARLDKQMPQQEKAARSDAVIANTSSIAELEKAVISALEHIGISPEAEDRLNQAELESYLPDDYDN
jgi:dephospho-CoA kinase